MGASSSLLAMKTLYPPQVEAADFFVKTLLDGRNTLDSSQMGTGKTVVGCQVAKELIQKSDRINRVAVICPKAVFPSWESELKECGLDPVFILNVEKLRAGKTGHVVKIGKKGFGWELPKDTLVLVDEIHKCKGPWSLNANLLVALVRQGYPLHGMSGTPCESPVEMRPLGYMLGLHNNDQKKGGKPSFFSWLNTMKCFRGHWGGYEMENPKFAQKKLRECMYGINTHGLTVSDFPDSFRDNRVVVDPIQFKNNNKIVRAYKNLNMDEEEILEYINNGRISPRMLADDNEDPVIVRILRARQDSEMHKVTDIVEMAQDSVAEGYSVVVFLNFKESLMECASMLECDYIDGSVSSEDRNRIIEEFQADQTNCIVVNAATGGTGVSLHDTHGNRPRLSLISPSFNAKEFAQVLGRIHRNGAKTDALQRVMLSHGSIEEYVMNAIATKLKAMDNIHKSNICQLTSSAYKS
jgi:superfamily II DNA or RNA helicase